MSTLRAFATMSTFASMMMALGCSSAGPGDKQTDPQPSELRPLTAEELAHFKGPPGITVTGALPTVTAEMPEAIAPDDIRVGGNGGNGPYYLSDIYYTGFTGRDGSYIDQIQFFGATETTQSFGGNGGSYFGDIICPSGMVLVGITGRSGSYVDQLGAICGTPTSLGIAWGNVGGNGGNAFNYRCPIGDWIVGWQVRAGGYVDQLYAVCGS